MITSALQAPPRGLGAIALGEDGIELFIKGGRLAQDMSGQDNPLAPQPGRRLRFLMYQSSRFFIVRKTVSNFKVQSLTK